MRALAARRPHAHAAGPHRAAAPSPLALAPFRSAAGWTNAARPAIAQCKLAVDAPGDLYEQEAERLAEETTRRPDAGAGRPVATRRVGSEGVAVSGAPTAHLDPAPSAGQPLDGPTRAFVEPRFGHDFGRVRVHMDGRAADSARALNARAFTVGQDIFFGAGQYRPGTGAGTRLIAHELAHTLQQDGGGGAAVVAQRQPDDKGEPRGGSMTNSTYQEEMQVIRYALGARDLGRLGDGTVLYQATGWKAVGMADGGFYAGPFLSDMGQFYYVYRFTGSTPDSNTHKLSRGSLLPGRDTTDLAAALAQVRGNEAVTVTATGLIPPTGGGGGGAKKPGQAGEKGGQRQPPDRSAEKPATEAEADELTPHRKRWLKAGRVSMKDQINGLFGEIQKVKKTRIETWEKNAKIKDPKPIRKALEVAVEVVGYGMGGVVGGLLTKAMAHGLAQEFVKEAALKGTVKLTAAIYANAVEPTEKFMAEATKKALQDKTSNAEKALMTKTNMLDCYVEAESLQSISEEHADREEFNATVDQRFPTDIALADEVAVVDALYKRLFERPEYFMRQLSEGLIRLKDEVYLEEKAKAYGGSRERMLKEDPEINETAQRSGNLLLLPAVYGSIGKWSSPRLDYFASFRALATEVNTATLQQLSGAAVKDLPLSLTFRFWANNPYSGLFVSPLCKVWFSRRSDGSVWVDFDESGPGDSVEDGLEWLASYDQYSSREFGRAERRKYAPAGAKKLYDQIKNKPVSSLSNFDIF